MKTLPASHIVLAGGLSGLAGFVDAVGYLQLRGAFVSFMSGNSTMLAIGLSRGDAAATLLLSGILALFVIGVMLGSVLAKAMPAERHIAAVLALVSTLLAVAALAFALGAPFAAVASMALAMGAANATFQRDGDVVVGVTYMTGTLVKFAQKLTLAATGGPRWEWVPYLWLWAALILGGCLGARTFLAFGTTAVYLAVGWGLALTLCAWVSKPFRIA